MCFSISSIRFDDVNFRFVHLFSVPTPPRLQLMVISAHGYTLNWCCRHFGRFEGKHRQKMLPWNWLRDLSLFRILWLRADSKSVNVLHVVLGKTRWRLRMFREAIGAWLEFQFSTGSKLTFAFRASSWSPVDHICQFQMSLRSRWMSVSDGQILTRKDLVLFDGCPSRGNYYSCKYELFQKEKQFL